MARTHSASLIADSNGDLFGTTDSGGADDDGTVFEIVKTAGGYASTPTTLVSFNGDNGAYPDGSLIADSNDDLFGTTTGVDFNGNTLNDGTVFEIAKIAGGYASAPTTLVSFNGDNGASPDGSLIADSSGDLFGTSDSGGARRRRDGVRNCQDRRRLRQHADHAGQIQRNERFVTIRRPDRRRRRGPLRHHQRPRPDHLRSFDRRHGVRDQKDGRRLRDRSHHTGQV